MPGISVTHYIPKSLSSSVVAVAVVWVSDDFFLDGAETVFYKDESVAEVNLKQNMLY